MSHDEQFTVLPEKEDTVPIGSLHILSSKYEVSYYNKVQCKKNYTVITNLFSKLYELV